MVVKTSDLRRREFITLLGGMTVAWPLAARAQRFERVQRIGMLMSFPASDPEAPIRVAALLQRLQELGWTDRRNVQIDYRWAALDVDRMRAFATELVGLRPDVLLAGNTTTLAALRQATRSIPIVFTLVADPIGGGFDAGEGQHAVHFIEAAGIDSR